MNQRTRRGLALLLIFSLSACGRTAPEAEPTAPVALVEVQPVATSSLRDSLVAYGTAEFAASNSVTLSVQVEAQVAAVLVTAGAEVKAGQALLRLAPTPATRLVVGSARRDAAQAETERARQQRLRGDGLATEAELQASVNAAAAAKTLLASLEARIGGSGAQTLNAPRAGIVDEIRAQPGDVLMPGVAALRIASPDALQVRLGVEPEDAATIMLGQQVRLTPLTPDRAAVEAVVDGFDRRVDPQTRLTAALVRLPPGTGLPGAVLRGEIVIALHENVVAVKPAALLYGGDTAYVFVAVDGKAQRRVVKLGLRDGALIEITDGLKVGESVVVAGNAALEDGMALRTQAGYGAAAP